MGPKERRSTVLSALEEAAIVSLRVQARLPLDDVYIALKRCDPASVPFKPSSLLAAPPRHLPVVKVGSWKA